MGIPRSSQVLSHSYSLRQPDVVLYSTLFMLQSICILALAFLSVSEAVIEVPCSVAENSGASYVRQGTSNRCRLRNPKDARNSALHVNHAAGGQSGYLGKNVKGFYSSKPGLLKPGTGDELKILRGHDNTHTAKKDHIDINGRRDIGTTPHKALDESGHFTPKQLVIPCGSGEARLSSRADSRDEARRNKGAGGSGRPIMYDGKGRCTVSRGIIAQRFGDLEDLLNADADAKLEKQKGKIKKNGKNAEANDGDESKLMKKNTRIGDSSKKSNQNGKKKIPDFDADGVEGRGSDSGANPWKGAISRVVLG